MADAAETSLQAGASTATQIRRWPSGWWLLVITLAIASLLRFAGLGEPAEVYFDETYYANDAVVYLEGPDAFRHNLDEKYGGKSREDEILPVAGKPGEISWVHPPVGKWLIAAGIALFGKNPWGWRIMSAIFGTGLVAITYLIAFQFWRRHLWAMAAGLLVAVDGLAIVQSRVAMLDIFATTFIALAFLFAVMDRRHSERVSEDLDASEPSAELPEMGDHPFGDALAGGDALLGGETPAAAGFALAGGDASAEAGFALAGGGDSFGHLPAGSEEIGVDQTEVHRVPMGEILFSSKWRVLTGLALGAAIATKWTGAYAIATVALLLFIWSLTLRRPGRTRITNAAIGFPSLLVCLVAIPGLLYVASYTGWFLDTGHGSILDDPGRVTKDFVSMQTETLKYHRSLNASHPYQSTPESWPLMSRPIAYWYHEADTGWKGHILAVGNPFIWWLFLATAPVVLAFGLVRKDWRDAVIIAGYLGLYLPWFLSPRTAFFYYMTPLVPFMALALVSAARRAPDVARPAAGVAVVGGAVVGCAIFFPIWVGISIPPSIWARLMLFSSWV